jgi:hypothetical protein
MRQVKLRPKDLNKWLKESAPGVHMQLQSYWDTDASPPNVVVSLEMATGCIPEYGIVHFNPSLISDQVEEMLENRICETAEQVLTGIYGEEDTHHISSLFVPEFHLECKKLYEKAFTEKDGQILIRLLNIRSQEEGIGKIGYDEAISRAYSQYDADRKAKFVLEKLQKSSAKRADKIDRMLGKYFLAIRIGAAIPEAAKGIISLYSFAINQTSSIAGYNVSKIFRKEFDGRMRELIRRKIEYDPSLDPIVIETIDICGARELYRRLGMKL